MRVIDGMMHNGAVPEAPAVIRGFEHVNRYWDKMHATYAAKILPGEYYVTVSDEAIVTVLGSCVSACIRDVTFGIGGMNHFMLPERNVSFSSSEDLLSDATRYGNYAMEHLINDILKNGGSRKNLEVKIVGGGRIIQHMTNIGLRNVSFVKEYLEMERLHILGEDVGGIYPRKVMYYPRTGRMLVKKLKSMHNDTIVARESRYMKDIDSQPVAGEVELF